MARGGPQDFTYIKPSELVRKRQNQFTLEELKARANAPDEPCDCGSGLNVWKYPGVGLCFICVTGESDASDDYELLPED